MLSHMEERFTANTYITRNFTYVCVCEAALRAVNVIATILGHMLVI